MTKYGWLERRKSKAPAVLARQSSARQSQTVAYSINCVPHNLNRRRSGASFRDPVICLKSSDDGQLTKGFDAGVGTQDRAVRRCDRRQSDRTAQNSRGRCAVLSGGRRFWLWRAVDDEGGGASDGRHFEILLNLICGTARGARSFSIDFTRVDGAFICTALKHGT